jgi:hypothetical protein
MKKLGVNKVLGFKFVPTNLPSLYQHALRNFLSQSLSIYLGNPWSINTSLKKKNYVVHGASYSDGIMNKDTKLVHRPSMI